MVMHDGRLHRVTPLHGDAGCSSASPFWRNGNCSPTRAASSTRCCRRAMAVSTNSLLEDRARVQHMVRCAQQDVRSRAFFRCAHDQRAEEKLNKLVQTLRLNHDTTDIHSTEENTKMEHSESIYTGSRSSQRTLTRVPKVTTESYPL